MAREISPHPFPVTVIFPRIAPQGGAVLVLLISPIPKMDLPSVSGRFISNNCRIFLEIWSRCEINDGFIHLYDMST